MSLNQEKSPSKNSPDWVIPSADIVVEGVSRTFPGETRPAVDNVSFEVTAGDLVVLLGPSGCGKTTLLKMINRLYEPTTGSIRIGGVDITSLPATQLRRQIGYVIQQVGLFPHMTIRKNISVVPRLLGWEPAAHRTAHRRTCWILSGCRRPTWSASQGSSPAGSSSASAWRAPWQPTRPSC